MYKDGKWGTYRHIKLDGPRTVETEYCFVDAGSDLSNTRWIEGPIKITRELQSHKEHYIIYVSRSAENSTN